MNIEEIRNYLITMPAGTKLYLGCDSARSKLKGVWHATYTVVLVVHKGGNNGCKIFGEMIKERDYDQKKDKPAYRLMNEVYKVAEFYTTNFAIFDEFEKLQREMEPNRKDALVEIHLDINPDEAHGSSCVITQATGYIKGLCGIDPKVKPVAFGASYAADRYGSITQHKSKAKIRKDEKKSEKREAKKSKRK